MKTTWRFLLVGGFLCISSGTSSAQRFVAVVPSPPANPAQFVQPDPPSPLPDDGTWAQGWPDASYQQESPGAATQQETKSGQQPIYGYARGDQDFVDSKYVDYDKALALGKETLAQQSAPAPPEPSFADVVREVQHSATKSSDSTGIVVEQDSNGKLFECKGAGSTCHPVG